MCRKIFPNFFINNSAPPFVHSLGSCSATLPPLRMPNKKNRKNFLTLSTTVSNIGDLTFFQHPHPRFNVIIGSKIFDIFLQLALSISETNNAPLFINTFKKFIYTKPWLFNRFLHIFQQWLRPLHGSVSQPPHPTKLSDNHCRHTPQLLV